MSAFKILSLLYFAILISLSTSVIGFGIDNPEIPRISTDVPTAIIISNTSGGGGFSNDSYVLKAGDTMTGNLNMNGNNITNVTKLGVSEVVGRDATVDAIYFNMLGLKDVNYVWSNYYVDWVGANVIIMNESGYGGYDISLNVGDAVDILGSLRLLNGKEYFGLADQISIQANQFGEGLIINPREVGAGNLTVLGGINTSYQVNALSYTGNGSQLTGVADSGNCAGGSAVQNATDTGLQCIGSLAIIDKNNVFTKSQNITTGGLYMSNPMTDFVMGHATGFGYPVYLQLRSPKSTWSIFRIYSNISGSFQGVTDIFSNGLQKWYLQDGNGYPQSQITYAYASGSNGAITFTNNTGSFYRAEVGGLLYGGLYLTSSLTSTQGTNFVYVYPTNLTLKGLPLYSNNAITATNYSVNTLAGISTNISLTNSTGSACYMNFTKGLLTGSNC